LLLAAAFAILLLRSSNDTAAIDLWRHKRSRNLKTDRKRRVEKRSAFHLFGMNIREPSSIAAKAEDAFTA